MYDSKKNRKYKSTKKPMQPIAAINYKIDQQYFRRFVHIHEIYNQAIIIECDVELNKDNPVEIILKNIESNVWECLLTQVSWIEFHDSINNYKVELKIVSKLKETIPFDQSENKIHINDLEFLLNTSLLKVIPQKDFCSLLNCLKKKNIDSGVKFIAQGKDEDFLFLIQKGLCTIQTHHENLDNQIIAHRREGDVVGEMALLTGEKRTADVISESAMILWKLTRASFDVVAYDHPDLQEFLTELLTNRLENSTAIGVRNVGRYIMTHRIGDGGWSFVYKGKHKILNMPVGIKMMKHNKAMDEDFIENFRNEGKIIAQLNHPNIVQIYDIEELYRTIFIVIEYLEGESLETLLLRKGTLPFPRALHVLRQISSGLAYAHDQDVIHRDIKPGNIFLTRNDHIKILDFGLACSPGEEDFDQTGTIHYMSPEQIEGEPVDNRSDIYSFGILTYEILTGQKPFGGDDLLAVMRMHQTKEIPDPTDIVPDIPEDAVQLIKKACAKSADDRYNSMQEVNEVLTSIADKINIKENHQVLRETEVTVLMIPHTKEQGKALNLLLDEFSIKAAKKGLVLKIVGNTQLENG